MTVSRYADFATVSHHVKLTLIDNAVIGISRALGYRAGLSVDLITRAVLDASAGSYTHTANDTVLTRDVLGEVTQIMEDGEIEPPADQSGFFPTLTSPLDVFDLMHDPEVGGVVDLLRGTRDPVLQSQMDRGRVIDIAQARVISTTNVWTSGGTRRTYILGAHTFGFASIAGMEPTSVTDPKTQNFKLLINHNPNGNTQDPTGAIATSIGYRFYYGAALLGRNNVVGDDFRIRVLDLAPTLAA